MVCHRWRIFVAEEVDESDGYYEGATKKILVNVYERNAEPEKNVLSFIIVSASYAILILKKFMVLLAKNTFMFIMLFRLQK